MAKENAASFLIKSDSTVNWVHHTFRVTAIKIKVGLKTILQRGVVYSLINLSK
jgi:hypothetical protein